MTAKTQVWSLSSLALVRDRKWGHISKANRRISNFWIHNMNNRKMFIAIFTCTTACRNTNLSICHSGHSVLCVWDFKLSKALQQNDKNNNFSSYPKHLQRGVMLEHTLLLYHSEVMDLMNTASGPLLPWVSLCSSLQQRKADTPVFQSELCHGVNIRSELKRCMTDADTEVYRKHQFSRDVSKQVFMYRMCSLIWLTQEPLGRYVHIIMKAWDDFFTISSCFTLISSIITIIPLPLHHLLLLHPSINSATHSLVVEGNFSKNLRYSNLEVFNWGQCEPLNTM